MAMEFIAGKRGYLLLVVVVLVFAPSRSHGGTTCCYSSCGSVQNITHPFRLKSDPLQCGDPQHQLTCENNQAMLQLQSWGFPSKKYLVKSINYCNHTIRVVDPSVLNDNCSSVPSFMWGDYNYTTPRRYWDYSFYSMVFVNCSAPVNDSFYIAAPPCRDSGVVYSYVLLEASGKSPIWGPFVGEINEGCNVLGYTVFWNNTKELRSSNPNYTAIRATLQAGFELDWQSYFDVNPCPLAFHSFHCFLKLGARELVFIFHTYGRRIGYILLGRTSTGVLFFILFLFYKLWRRHRAMDDKTEAFLSEYKNHMPTRYSYWQLSRITNRFQEKLGKGGFGFVYKGKLSDGTPVAVKMLDKSKGNGQDFINEVATIGRIHHLNVVQLIGFCAERTKRALIYEYMPNGSLDKHLFSQNKNSMRELSWKNLYEIALGIARGIEYLHMGCNMKILHFDIKPHNILLDENFIPKVSDFGLAKFYPIKDCNTVSLTTVRGTLGYIAPELFYRRIGNVSHKSDVYSYGMLLMEIAGRRRNMNPNAENSSQVYFPLWIYDQLIQGRDIAIDEAADNGENDITRKLVVVSLWCIQMKPADRPSMSRVVEMLEGSLENLEMPKRPFFSPPDLTSNDDHVIELEPLEPPSMSSVSAR